MKLRKLSNVAAQVLLRSGANLHAEYQFGLFVKVPSVTFWTAESGLSKTVIAAVLVPTCSQDSGTLITAANELIQTRLPAFRGVIHSSAEDR